MNILVVGGARYIGSHMIRAIKKLINYTKNNRILFNIEQFNEFGIKGWAHTTDGEAIEIVLMVDDKKIISTPANKYREDLQQAGKLEGKCAFFIKPNQFVTKEPTQHIKLVGQHKKFSTVLVNQPLPKRAEAVNPGVLNDTFKSYLQKIDNGQVSGWISFGETSETISLVALVDGELIGKYKTQGTRQDLIKAGIKGTHSSFSFKLPEKYWDSTKHIIEIKTADKNQHINGSPKDFFLKNSNVNRIKKHTFHSGINTQKTAQLKGNIDNLRNGKVIRGWATNSEDDHLTVEILFDKKTIGEVKAIAYRSDLEKANINGGNAAFEFMPPGHLFDNKKHVLELRDKKTKKIICVKKDVLFANSRSYKDYDEYLRWSFFTKEIYAPFAEEDKRVLSYMDWYVKRERELYLKNCLSGKLVSIIMPTYKRANIILKAIQSVIDQSYANWQLVIVDDGGQDNTKEVLEQLNDPRITYFDLEKNQGASAARNKALALSTGDYICYLDSDNTWHEDFLLLMLGNLESNPDFDVAYCAQYLFRGEVKTPFAMRYGMFNKTLLKNRNYIDINCIIHSRALYEKKGGFDNNLRRLVDWDLLLRYTEEKAPLTVPAILSNYYFNQGEETITVSESLADALQGLKDKDIESNKVAILDHAAIDFNSDGGNTESLLTGVVYYSEITQTHDELAKRLSQKRKSAIVVVSFNIPGIFKQCLDSMIATVDLSKTEIIIVDNLSNEETVKLITEYDKKYPQIKLQLNNYNFGFTHAVNQGIEMADDDADIVLINNDAIATPGWLNAMEEVVINYPDVGIVAPQQVLLPNTKTMNVHSPFANLNHELDVTISAHHDNLRKVKQSPSQLVDVHFIPFFCVYIPRETINAVGILDAELGRHYRSDRLYCNAVTQYAKKRIVFTPNSKLYHLHQQSTSSLKKKDDKEFKEMFTENKWNENELYKTPIWELT